MTDSKKTKKQLIQELSELRENIAELNRTGVQQIEAALRGSETKYRSLVHCSSDAILMMNIQRDIISCNRAFLNLFGYGNNEIEGKSIRIIHPSDQSFQRFGGLAYPEIDNGNAFRAEWDFMMRDGSIIPVETVTSAIKDADGVITGYAATIRDITERKLAEKMLIDSEEEMRATLAASPIGIGRIKNRLFDWVNKSACRMFGYTFEDFTGRNSRFLYESDDDYKKAGDLLYNRGWYETRLVKKDGSLVDVFVQSTPIGDDSYIVTATDITISKKTENELLKVGKLESLGVLAGGIAHDFNNVLATFLGNISLAKMYARKDPEKVIEKLNNAEQAITKAKDLTQQLLTFSKGGSPVKKMHSINDLLKDTAQFSLRGTDVKCEFEFAGNLFPVEIDEGQISQVIGNLVMNAQQAMPDGGVILVDVRNVTLEENAVPLEKGNYVRISIKDQGIGIPEEYLDKIFDPYFTTKEKASGLGLAICYSIIAKHSGHITVETEPETGSTFYLYLPAAGKMLSSKETDASDLFMGSGKVLVMDDEESIRDVLGEILNSLGYEVNFAKDGNEAVKLYKKEDFDVVILDLTVPGGMGGKETMQKLLKIDPHIKGVVSSGYSNDPIMAEYEKYGFKGVIAKPYKINDLSNVIRKVMRSDNQ